MSGIINEYNNISCSGLRSNLIYVNTNRYMVLDRNNLLSLEKEVEIYIQNGWSPLGGIQIDDKRGLFDILFGNDSDKRYIQPMILSNKDYFNPLDHEQTK